MFFGELGLLILSVCAAYPALGAAPTTVTPQTLMIPAYVYPGGAANLRAWDAFLTPAYAEATGYIIVNPSNGPGTSVDPNYETQMARAVGRGFKLIGYVMTGWGSRAAAEVTADIAAWRSLYGRYISGFFLDEGATEYTAVYDTVAAAIRANASSGFTVINPGTVPAERFAQVFDVVVIHEDESRRAGQFAAPTWMGNYPSSKYCILYLATPNATRMRQLHETIAQRYGIGYVYYTDDTLNNPWDRLPAYYSSMVAMLTRVGTPAAPYFTAAMETVVPVLRRVAAGGNVYGSSPSYINMSAAPNELSSTARTVCATYVSKLLQYTFGTAVLPDSVLKANLNGSTGYAENYYAAMTAQTGWVRVWSASDLVAGDILASRYAPEDPSSDTGHVMMVVNVTRRASATAPIVAGTDQWEVWVSDSSASYHGSLDTRAPPNTEGGIGLGVMRLYTNATMDASMLLENVIAGWSWSTVGASTYYAMSSTRPIAAARPVFTPATVAQTATVAATMATRADISTTSDASPDPSQMPTDGSPPPQSSTAPERTTTTTTKARTVVTAAPTAKSRTPVVARGFLRLLGRFQELVEDAAKRERLSAALRSDIARKLRALDETAIAITKLVVGSLEVDYDVTSSATSLGQQDAATGSVDAATFNQTMKDVDNNKDASWLSSTLAVYEAEPAAAGTPMTLEKSTVEAVATEAPANTISCVGACAYFAATVGVVGAALMVGGAVLFSVVRRRRRLAASKSEPAA